MLQSPEWERLRNYRCKEFETDFTPVSGPGFFPGAGGYFHDCSAEGSRRGVFFGTDFGHEQAWRDVKDGGGSKRTQPTLASSRRIVEEAGVDPCACHLTNAVLALARNGSMTGNHRIYQRHGEYLKLCAEFHREWIRSHAPDLVVLMGTPNVEIYRRHIFQYIFPVLETRWGGLKAPWERMYEEHKELVETEPGKPDVLWMFHPSYRHANPRFGRVTDAAERKKLRVRIWERTIEHLRAYGS